MLINLKIAVSIGLIGIVGLGLVGCSQRTNNAGASASQGGSEQTARMLPSGSPPPADSPALLEAKKRFAHQ